MKVLFLSALFPYPLISGGHVRIYNLLKRLGRRHDVTLFACIRRPEEKRFVPEIKAWCTDVRLFYRGRAWQPKYIARALTSSLPFLLATYEHRALSAVLTEDYVKGFDVIHCEPFYVAHVLPRHRSTRMVVTEHNIEYAVYGTYAHRYRLFPPLSFLMQWDVAKMKRWEERLWTLSDHVICVSQKDKTVIEKVVPGKVTVVPNGVDTAYFRFRARAIDPLRPRLLFVGNYRWFPNVEAVQTLLERVWPFVKVAYPGATLTIAGSHMSPKIRRLGDTLGARMLGFAEDIREVYDKADIFLAPMGIAGGSKFKILEAMAAGCPVITTKEGVTGLTAQDGTHVLLFETPEDVVSCIRLLLENPGRVSRLTRSARTLTERDYGWDTIADVLDRVWRKA